MFSSFPRGAPGLGLLLLRAVLGIYTILQGAASLSVAAPWFGTLAIVSGAFLLLGLFTPFAAGIVGMGAVGIAFFQAKWTLWPAVLLAAAIALLGPGAFSIDARLFGRREIVIPPVTRRSPDSGTKKP
jgi:uncharacterized membrane protein YphA (DoxX/SURF4 family)